MESLRAENYRTSRDLATHVATLANEYASHADEVRNLLRSRGGIFGVGSGVLDDEQLMRTVLVCLSLTLFDPHLIGAPIAPQIKRRILEAAEILGIPTSDIVPLSFCESELMQILH